MLAVGFSEIPLIIHSILYLALLIIFVSNKCWIFIKCFFCIYWDNFMFFFYSHYYGIITLNEFWVLNQLCIAGINLKWSQCSLLFIFYCIQNAEILLKFLHLCSWCIMSIVLFSNNIFTWFWYLLMLASLKELESIPNFSNFLKEFVQNSYYLFVSICCNSSKDFFMEKIFF